MDRFLLARKPAAPSLTPSVASAAPVAATAAPATSNTVSPATSRPSTGDSPAWSPSSSSSETAVSASSSASSSASALSAAAVPAAAEPAALSEPRLYSSRHRRHDDGTASLPRTSLHRVASIPRPASPSIPEPPIRSATPPPPLPPSSSSSSKNRSSVFMPSLTLFSSTAANFLAAGAPASPNPGSFTNSAPVRHSMDEIGRPTAYAVTSTTSATSSSSAQRTQSKLRHDLLGLLNDPSTTDVTIIVGEDLVEFKAHK
ncbi:hypothetical protein HK405_009511 [Cladochytrium tenue]|nr:hypothetical protein HK405_009511 [Cladochytrium tenue]